MKLKVFTWFLIQLMVTASFAQLKINSNVQIGPSAEELENFIKSNHLEEVVIAWKSSNWLPLKSTFYALLKQNKKYFITKITNDISANDSCANYLIIRYCNLRRSKFKKYVDNNLKLSEAFKYTQKDFDQLPETCTLNQDNKTIELSIYDRSYWHLLTSAANKMLHIKKYAPDFFLQYCEEDMPEYTILRGFTTTHSWLIDLVETNLSIKTAKVIVIRCPTQSAPTFR